MSSFDYFFGKDGVARQVLQIISFDSSTAFENHGKRKRLAPRKPKRSWRMVIIKFDLTWKKQVYSQTAKANKLLGHIRRNTTFINNTAARRSVYLALVRSHFGYASQVWAPQSIELLHKLERTRRPTTKYILNLPFRTDIEYIYRTRLQSYLHFLSLCYWHEYFDLILFFKITKGLEYHRSKKQNPTYQKSFLVRSCKIWNNLC